MKTISLVFILAFLVACGKIESGNEFSIVRKYDPLALNTTDKSSVNALCGVLAQKVVALDSTLGANYSFKLATKDCDDDNLGASKDVLANSAKEGSNYVFKVGLSSFRFQYIETNSSGILKDICNGGTSLTNPYKDATGNVVWFSFVQSTSDCPAIVGNQCILIETGVPKAGSVDSYTVLVRDWVSFVVAPNYANPGFYTYRKQKNKSTCTSDKYQEAIAILK